MVHVVVVLLWYGGSAMVVVVVVTWWCCCDGDWVIVQGEVCGMLVVFSVKARSGWCSSCSCILLVVS